MDYIKTLIVNDAKNHRLNDLKTSFDENPLLTIKALNEGYPSFLHSYISDLGFSQNQEEETFFIDLIKAGFNYKHVSQDETLLHVSCGAGLLALTKTLLDLNVDTKTKDSYHMDCFHIACINNKLEMAQYLYKHIVVDLNSINFIGDNLFLSAIRYSSVSMLEFLDSIGVNINYINTQTENGQYQDALLLAVRDEKINTIQYLLNNPHYKLDNFDSTLNYAKQNNMEVFHLLNDYKNTIDEKAKLEHILTEHNQKKKVKI